MNTLNYRKATSMASGDFDVWEPAALQAELAAAIGPAVNNSWFIAGIDQFCTVSFADPISQATVDAVCKAHFAGALARAKAAAVNQARINVNQFIAAKPDGSVRYDQALQMNLIVATLKNSAPDKVALVQTWIAAVQGHYFALTTAIAAAATIAEVEAIDISIPTLEAQFGVAGTVLPDPNVYTRDLNLVPVPPAAS